MSVHSDVEKDEDREVPVPVVWREMLSNIVDRISVGDYEFHKRLNCVNRVDVEMVHSIKEVINSYGVNIGSLPDEAWSSSVCRWMRGYWQVLVDLYADNGDETDLVLFCKVFEVDGGFQFQVDSVHVP